MPDSKLTLLQARLQKRLRALELDSFKQYCEYLEGENAQAEILQLIDCVTTNKTDFFREPSHFDQLKDVVVPDLLGKPGSDGASLRFWSAGCSSGEEPYTVAMVLAECRAKHAGLEFEILATDLSNRVLTMGRAGIYSDEKVSPVPRELLKKYFLRSKDRSQKEVRVVPELREKVRFRRLNLLGDAFDSVEPIDVLFCRNVMIYFDRVLQEDILGRLVARLRSGGYLFLGHSETVNGLRLPLRGVGSALYQKSE